MRRLLGIRLVGGGGGFALFLLLAAGALAFFSATGSGSSTGGTNTLTVPGSPAAAGSGTHIQITWTASTIGGSTAATSYAVERYSSSGSDLGAASCSPVASSSGTPNAFGSFSCTDSPAGGTYKYKITAQYHTSWTATTGFTGTATAQAATSTSASGPASASTGGAIAASSIGATLSGATAGATGTVTFKVFGPQATAPSTCTSGGTTVGTASVSGNGTYNPSAGYTPASAGTYWWYASYGGDSNNLASASTCGSGMASTAVTNVTTTSASGPVTGTAGTAIAPSSISSTLAGATAGATGTVMFKVFGPQATPPTACTSGGTTVGTATVSGNATYHPGAGFTPSAAGTYWWYASYGGDANNAASASTCGIGMSSSVVAQATTATSATGPATASTSVAITTSSISSTLSGATSGATGTVTFTVFGPQATAPAICTTGGTTVGTATVSGNATYNPSAGFTPASPGTYWWYASYGGDSSNLASASTCGSGMASTVVTNATTTSASAPATGTAGTAIAASSIASTLSGASSGATGTVTFKVFGPQATAPTTCTSGGTTVGTATVSGSATYSPSAGFTPASAGTYWWYASYGGDSSNDASASTCGTGMTATYVYSASSAASGSTTSGTAGTTSSFTVAANTTYLLLVFRHSATGDGVTSITSSGLSPALSLSSFTSIASQNFNTSDYQWAYWITTSSSASGTGTLTINFTKSLGSGQMTLVNLVQIGGNSTTNPIVTANIGTASGSSNAATVSLPSAPSASDAGFVFLGGNKLGNSTPSANPAMSNLFYSGNNNGSLGTYGAIPASQTETFSNSNAAWGTIALEVNHG